MELSKAKEIAIEVGKKLQPHCNIIHIAGSIRRKKPEVKDIEIVCLPKIHEIDNGFDLFGKKHAPSLMRTNEFINEVGMLGKIEKGNPEGRYVKIILPELINLDLFIPDPPDFYRQYAIRTGSADYAFKVIANGWRKKGWVGSDLGLRLEKDCLETKQPDGKSKWTCVRNKNNTPPIWQSEIEFFEWINVPYVKPEFRNI